tara:strand:- start:1097 stop:1273 length:177 start_codon:yes stop_codon:yes gene_type:complete
LKTFYVKGKITEFYKASLIEASSEQEAIIIYEEELISGGIESDSTDLEVWNEMEIEES